MRAFFVVTALALAGGASVHADTVPNRARDLAERGRNAHDAKDYSTAIVSFTEAYALAPAPGLLFNLTQAYRLRGNCDDAALMYRRFLATNPPDDARLLAEAHLSTVERCLAAKITVPVEAKVLRMPAAMPIGKREHARVTAKSTKPGWRTGQQVGLGLAIGGGAALLFAGYYGYESHQAETDVERRYAAGEKWKTLEARAAEGDRAEKYAKVSLGIGAAAIAAGAAVLVIDHRRHKTLKIEPVARGARIGMSWAF
jgi:tetratricopeptide (TPR) repeat protein